MDPARLRKTFLLRKIFLGWKFLQPGEKNAKMLDSISAVSFKRRRNFAVKKRFLKRPPTHFSSRRRDEVARLVSLTVPIVCRWFPLFRIEKVFSKMKARHIFAYDFEILLWRDKIIENYTQIIGELSRKSVEIILEFLKKEISISKSFFKIE